MAAAFTFAFPWGIGAWVRLKRRESSPLHDGQSFSAGQTMAHNAVFGLVSLRRTLPFIGWIPPHDDR